tara:strand:- start:8114 stop:9058 length:945 start_codon:yes stop_codon:yes gene_type:complete
MRASVLHITNGDITTNSLKKINFSGSFITWREMLSEGKTTSDIGSESFWKNRFEFLRTSYNISKKNFIDNTLKEYRNLCNEKEQDEIVLWFDQDLFCQINMLAVISWLKRYRKGYQISLVCSAKLNGSKKNVGLSKLNATQIQQQYKNRIELKQDDIEYADYIWQLYCSDSPLRLETVYKLNSISPFKHLAAAIEAHLKRFPSIENGLNKIENRILKTVDNQNFPSKNKLISRLIKEEKVYGFGDVQYGHHLKSLNTLFSSFTPVKLSSKGKRVLENQINFYGQIRNDISYLGGSKKYSFLYQNETNKLLQITS